MLMGSINLAGTPILSMGNRLLPAPWAIARSAKIHYSEIGDREDRCRTISEAICVHRAA